MHHKTIAVLQSRSSDGFGFIGSCFEIRLQAFVSSRHPYDMRHVRHDFGNISGTPKLIDQSDIAPRNASCQIMHSDKSRMTAAISGSDIRNIMLEAVAPRFKTLRAAATTEMLTQQWPPLSPMKFRYYLGRSIGTMLYADLQSAGKRHFSRNSSGPVADKSSPFLKRSRGTSQ